MFPCFLIFVEAFLLGGHENLESSKNAGNIIGIHPQALISHFKQIINHKNPISTDCLKILHEYKQNKQNF